MLVKATHAHAIAAKFSQLQTPGVALFATSSKKELKQKDETSERETVVPPCKRTPLGSLASAKMRRRTIKHSLTHHAKSLNTISWTSVFLGEGSWR